MKYEILIHTASYDKSGFAEHRYNVTVTAESYGEAVTYAVKGFPNVLKVEALAKE